jgi:hypothetical protein
MGDGALLVLGDSTLSVDRRCLVPTPDDGASGGALLLSVGLTALFGGAAEGDGC